LTQQGRPSRLQQAFIDEQAAQCGYCTAGMIIQAEALLDQNPNPSEAEIRPALNTNLCRCGTQSRVVRAIQRAAKGGAAS
jgi:nicotinate dehydrogenase subunit A